MKSKLGGSKQLKPSMPSKNAQVNDPMASRGLVRRAAPQSKMPEKKGDKPMIDDITEPLDEALADVETKLADSPSDPELHKLKIKILRKMQNRPELRKALSEAANVCKTPFFAVKLAEQLEEDGAYADALEWRQWVADIHPDDPDTVRRLAATAVRAGELEIAEKTYTRLIKLRSDDELPLGGTFYEEMLGRGLPPEKRQELQKMGLRLLARALIHRETNASILEAAARIAYRTKSYTESRGAYEQAIRSNPNHKNVHQWKAELLNVYAQLGLQENWRKLNQSLIADLSEVVKTDHTDMRAWNMLAKQQIQAGLFDDAIVTLKGALRADSKNAQALWQLGRLYVRRGDSQSAIDFYRDIIDDPTEKKAIRRAIERALAELYFKLGHYDEALQIYMREVENNARMIAPILEATGNMEEAEELYIKSVVQNPRDAKSHLGLAEYWVRRGNWEKAKEAAQNGLQCSYATEEVHTDLAVALATSHMKLKDFDAALQTMEEITASYPDSIHCAFRKVKLLLLQGQNEEASRLAADISKSAKHQTGCAPSSSALWSLLGDTCSLLHDSDGAYNAYTQALNYDAMDTTAIRGLGILAERDKEYRLALNYYERFVLNDPLNLATPEIKKRIALMQEQIQSMPAENYASSQSYKDGDDFMGDHVAQPLIASKRNYGWIHGDSDEQRVNTGTTKIKTNTDGWLGDSKGSMDWYDAYSNY
ncbi:MAG: tetratricopeptide repeat protein [bacterium]|nr:tetratricopeptide repeat protein [bacterium]